MRVTRIAPESAHRSCSSLASAGSPASWVALERGGQTWRYGRLVAAGRERTDVDKVQRRAAQAKIAAYHDEQLRALVEHVREGLLQLDAGEIDVFELDDVIHRYKRAAKALWSFCGSTESQWVQAANVLAFRRERGEEPDWWAASAPRERRSS